MKVEVRLTEPYWRIVGKRNLQLDLDKDSNMRALFTKLAKEYPGLSDEMQENQAILFINEEEGSMDKLLEEGDHIHVVWPITGG